MPAPSPWSALAAAPAQVSLVTLQPFKRGERHPPIRIGSLFLVVCVAGQGELVIGGTAHALTPGLVAAVPWGVALELAADATDPFTIASIHLAPRGGADHPPRTAGGDAPAGQIPPAGGVLPPIPAGAVRPAVDAVALALAALRTWRDLGCDPALRRLRLDACGTLLATALAPGGQPVDDRLLALQSWLDLNFRRRIAVADMCQRSGLPRATLGRAFRRATGRSPLAYLLELRLAEAERLLATTHQGVAAVGRTVGFADPTHFIRLYRRRFGRTPGQSRPAGR